MSVLSDWLSLLVGLEPPPRDNFNHSKQIRALTTTINNITRNTHVHVCLTPVRRLCACVICRCRWGACGVCYVCCTV